MKRSDGVSLRSGMEHVYHGVLVPGKLLAAEVITAWLPSMALDPWASYSRWIAAQRRVDPASAAARTSTTQAAAHQSVRSMALATERLNLRAHRCARKTKGAKMSAGTGEAASMQRRPAVLDRRAPPAPSSDPSP
jgi:hypothetical protein